MSSTRATVSVVLGALGVVVWLVVAVGVWQVLPPVGTQVADTASSLRTAVAGVHSRLVHVDDAFARTSLTLEAFREEHAGDPETVRAERRRIAAEIAPVARQLRADLEAVREVVESIDNLLQTLDLPFLRTTRRAGVERVAALVDRVPRLGEGGRDLGLELEGVRRLVREAREQIAAWRVALDALDADLQELGARALRLSVILATLVTVLALWSLAGQICLVRAGARGLRRDPA